jgi:hypothetical protein
MMKYTKQQLENMSIEELKRIDQGLDRQTPIRPGDSVRDIEPPIQKESSELIWVDKDIYPPSSYYDSADYLRYKSQVGRVHTNHSIINNNRDVSGPEENEIIRDNFVLVISDYLYEHNQIQPLINRWAEDAINDNGWGEIIISLCNDCTENQIREFLMNQHYNNRVVGAFLVGDIPSAWFEHGAPSIADEYPSFWRYSVLDCNVEQLDENLYNAGSPVNQNPSDGCYCDNGVSCSNSLMNVYVGILKTKGCGAGEDCLDWNLGGYAGEIDAVVNYFNKNHQLRNTTTQNSNIIFHDGDVLPSFNYIWSNEEIDYFNTLSNNMTETIYDYENTSRDDFINKMNSTRMVSVSEAHGSPYVQTFSCGNHNIPNSCDNCFGDVDWYQQANSWDYPNCYQNFDYEDLLNLSDTSLFHIWVACGTGRFTEVNNLANWHLFHPTGGLTSISASASISGVQNFGPLFNYMKYNHNMGECWKNWYDDFLNNYGYPLSSNGGGRYVWNLLGDPTIKVSHPINTEINHQIETRRGTTPIRPGDSVRDIEPG